MTIYLFVFEDKALGWTKGEPTENDFSAVKEGLLSILKFTGSELPIMDIESLTLGSEVPELFLTDGKNQYHYI